MALNAIVAFDNNYGIGYNGNLLFSVSSDLKRFKKLTLGHTVIMGRKTWESLPKKPLPNRKNIVVTSKNLDVISKDVEVMRLEEVKKYIDENPQEEIFIIGGGQLYKEFIEKYDKIYATQIYYNFSDVDTYFPSLDFKIWQRVDGEYNIKTHKNYFYEFKTYSKRQIF